MKKDKLEEENITLETGFAFKAEKIKFNKKGHKEVRIYTNRENDITESKYNRNLPDKIQENKVYKRVEKHIEMKLRIVE